MRIYFAFAAGYLLSYLFRTINAVISPELSRDVSLDPSSLGLLTSAYFLAFGAAQLPVGMLLDRYGPRRVEPVLLSIAAVGALLFAYAETLPGLTFARAVIGLGVCACLMAPMKGSRPGSRANGTRRCRVGSWSPVAWVRLRQRRRWNWPCASPAGELSSSSWLE
jgi:MFS family permease